MSAHAPKDAGRGRTAEPPGVGRGSAAATKPILRVEDVVAGYGSTVLLEGVSFAVNPAEVLTILGGSGSGKSTLMKLLIGLHQPFAGRIFVGDQDIVTADPRTLARIQRERFGVMYQSGALFGSMTSLENVMLPLEEFTDLPYEARRDIAQAKLRLVDLAHAGPLFPAELSGGMLKRVAIARAMALDPEILFLDEPSAGFDPVTAAGLDRTIRTLVDRLGVTVVIITHELASVFVVADRAIMIDRSARGIIAEGDPRWLRDHATDPRVQRFFQRRAEGETPT